MRKVLSTLFLLLLLTAWGQAALAADKNAPLPNDMVALMPASAEVVLLLKSLQDVDTQLAEILPPDDLQPLADLLSGLGCGPCEEFKDVVATDRPIAVMLNLPDAMGQGDLELHIILPLIDSAHEFPPSALEASDYFLNRANSYFSFSSIQDIPFNDMGPDWLAHVPPYLSYLRLDLGALIEKYRPMIDMGLGAMTMQANAQAENDSTGTQGLQVSEAEAIDQIVQDLLASLDVFDTTLNVDGSRISLGKALSLRPGSPWSPVPQPDFNLAQKAAALLPQEHGFIMATALAIGPILETWYAYYEATIDKLIATLDAEPAAKMRAWFDLYKSALDMYLLPMATTADVQDGQLVFDTAVLCEDPQASLSTIVALLNNISDSGMGFVAQENDPYELKGVPVRSWKLDFDLESMLDGPYKSQIDPAVLQAQTHQMELIMSRAISDMHLATAGDYLLISSGQDKDALEDMIQNAKKGKGKKQKTLADATRRAGPHAREVITGDLGSFVTWLEEIVADLEDDDEGFVWPLSGPMPFTGFATVSETKVGFELEVEKSDLRQLIAVTDEME